MAQASPAKVNVKNITQVAIAVHDAQTVAANYWNILGIGPWDIYEVKPPTLYGRTYHGKPGNFTYWLALTMVGQVQLELAQPISGDNATSYDPLSLNWTDIPDSVSLKGLITFQSFGPTELI